MRIDRTIGTAAAALLLAAALPVAAEPDMPRLDACTALMNEGLALVGEAIYCFPEEQGLRLKGLSPEGMRKLRETMFPEGSYHGNPILNEGNDDAQWPQLRENSRRDESSLGNGAARAQDSVAMRQAVLANFDGAANRAGVVLAQFGPPGSGVGAPGASGPPGSGRSGPPGSGIGGPGAGGPPGSGIGGSLPPGGGSAPPSRPAPVWRDAFPPPPPNWWNTDFEHYEWWERLPSDYSRYRTEPYGDGYTYYSPWIERRGAFTTQWGQTEDSATIVRTEANQDQIHTATLESRTFRDSKQCYYRAVYRYEWVEGGIYGSHWEDTFQRYDARCIRSPREYGPGRRYTANVKFDMGFSGPDLPWEKDRITVTYNGDRLRIDTSGASYKYTVTTELARDGENVTLTAGAKTLRAPESDKVQALLRVTGTKVELVITDDRAQFYKGETLRINAKIVREDDIAWSPFDAETTLEKNIDVTVGAANPQHVLDLSAEIIAAKSPKKVQGTKVFIDSWSFSRVGSKISSSEPIRKGNGPKIDYK